jgi:hypothetical protein
MIAQLLIASAVSASLLPQIAGTQPSPPRRWLPELRQTSTIEGASGRELYNPRVLAVTSRGLIVVYDMGTYSVRAFSPDGREMWSTGRKGSGPGEFQSASDIEPLNDGGVAVLDNELSRLTILDSQGRVKDTSPLAFGGTQLVPLDGGSAFGITAHDLRLLWRAVYPQARVGEGALPADISVDKSIIRSNVTAKAGASTSVVAFMWSSRVLFLDAKGAITTQWDGPELLSLPRAVTTAVSIPGLKNAAVTRVDPKAVRGASAVAATTNRAFVVFDGATPDRRRIVDVFDLPSGRYAGSYRLPERAAAIAALSDDRIVTLHDEPVPQLRVWEVASVRPSMRSKRNLSMTMRRSSEQFTKEYGRSRSDLPRG